MAFSLVMNPTSRVRSTKMRLRVSRPSDLVEHRHNFLEKLSQLRGKCFRQVANLAADARVARREPRAGQLLDEIVNLLTLGERVHEHAQSAGIHRERAQAEQVRGNAAPTRSKSPGAPCRAAAIPSP